MAHKIDKSDSMKYFFIPFRNYLIFINFMFSIFIYISISCLSIFTQINRSINKELASRSSSEDDVRDVNLIGTKPIEVNIILRSQCLHFLLFYASKVL
jgi:hypothetical protein